MNLRDAYTLFQIAGQSIKETAWITGASESNVKVRIHRARENSVSNFRIYNESDAAQSIKPQKRINEIFLIAAAGATNHFSEKMPEINKQFTVL